MNYLQQNIDAFSFNANMTCSIRTNLYNKVNEGIKNHRWSIKLIGWEDSNTSKKKLYKEKNIFISEMIKSTAKNFLDFQRVNFLHEQILKVFRIKKICIVATLKSCKSIFNILYLISPPPLSPHHQSSLEFPPPSSTWCYYCKLIVLLSKWLCL